ncbi:MAG: hypothetical protein IJ637_00595 [Prevotella sp.]|nr:hypothetical protein [Prevotella sp.]
MDKLINLGMNKLFQLAEYVCGKIGVAGVEETPVANQPRQDIIPAIRFSQEDKMVEGDLFE